MCSPGPGRGRSRTPLPSAPFRLAAAASAVRPPEHLSDPRIPSSRRGLWRLRLRGASGGGVPPLRPGSLSSRRPGPSPPAASRPALLGTPGHLGPPHRSARRAWSQRGPRRPPPASAPKSIPSRQPTETSENRLVNEEIVSSLFNFRIFYNVPPCAPSK